jgi:hypothetical protein
MTLGATRNFRPPDEFRVITGRTKLSSSAGQAHDLANYFWFVDKDGKPLWNPKTAQWDVVFLQLASSSKQQTIKIAGPGEVLCLSGKPCDTISGMNLSCRHKI